MSGKSRRGCGWLGCSRGYNCFAIFISATICISENRSLCKTAWPCRFLQNSGDLWFFHRICRLPSRFPILDRETLKHLRHCWNSSTFGRLTAVLFHSSCITIRKRCLNFMAVLSPLMLNPLLFLGCSTLWIIFLAILLQKTSWQEKILSNHTSSTCSPISLYLLNGRRVHRLPQRLLLNVKLESSPKQHSIRHIQAKLPHFLAHFPPFETMDDFLRLTPGLKDSQISTYQKTHTVLVIPISSISPSKAHSYINFPSICSNRSWSSGFGSAPGREWMNSIFLTVVFPLPLISIPALTGCRSSTICSVSSKILSSYRLGILLRERMDRTRRTR